MNTNSLIGSVGRDCMGSSDGKCVVRSAEGTERHGRRRLCWEPAKEDQSDCCADDGSGGARKAPVLKKGQEGGKS